MGLGMKSEVTRAGIAEILRTSLDPREPLRHKGPLISPKYAEVSGRQVKFVVRSPHAHAPKSSPHVLNY